MRLVFLAGQSLVTLERSKQGGGGTTWEVEQERLFLVMLSVVYDSDLGSLTFYKNNVLMGTSTTAVTGDVELMLCGTLPGQ
jgi:hypothetical protein